MQGSRHTCAISTSTTQVNANSANQTPCTYLISKIRDPNHDSHYVNLKESFLQGCLVDCLLALQDWLRQGIHMLNTKACSIKKHIPKPLIWVLFLNLKLLDEKAAPKSRLVPWNSFSIQLKSLLGQQGRGYRLSSCYFAEWNEKIFISLDIKILRYFTYHFVSVNMYY